MIRSRDGILNLIANQLDFLNHKFEGIRHDFTPNELQCADVILTTLEEAGIIDFGIDPSPFCSYGHKTAKDCDCDPIAEND